MPSSYLEKILTTNSLRESTLKSAIKSLELPKGSVGLDVGCGPGLQCLLLAEEIGESGHVTGERDEKSVQVRGNSDRAEFERLCKPDSPDFILEHPDYYAFFTYSVFLGTVI